MFICYIDESGDSQPVRGPKYDQQPMLIISGLFIDSNKLSEINKKFIELKKKFFHKRYNNIRHDLDILLDEIKGSDLRKIIRDGKTTSKIVQHHFLFLDELIDLCLNFEIKIVSRIWCKDIYNSTPLKDQSTYTKTIQHIATRFNYFLEEQENKKGIIIADFRDTKRNGYVSHSVFTQKNKARGDSYPYIPEVVTFGISNNHAGLQITDILTSCILSPISGVTFLNKNIYPELKQNNHVSDKYNTIKTRYLKKIKRLQYNCKPTVKDKYRFGITSYCYTSKETKSLFEKNNHLTLDRLNG